MTNNVAFQLGINVGKRQVKMAVLKDALEKSGFKNVRTIFASGNVVFEADEKNPTILAAKLDDLLSETFGFEIKNIVKGIDEIQQFIASEPFKNIMITPNIRVHVTFIGDHQTPFISIPYESPDKSFRIISIQNGMVCSLITLSEGRGTADVMAFLSKTFGRKITTRSWNTVLKIATIAKS